jgi:arylsulfatase A-like enzyme
VLLITIDTARLDRFSYTGVPGPGTPRIDALATEGAGFVNAITPVPLTLPAHASLLTGRQPPSHTVRDNGAYRLPESEETWAELLGEVGFTTAAFIGAEVLDARYRLDQGFTTYDDAIEGPGDSPLLYYPERSGEEVVAAATRWLDSQDEKPVFVWVHLFDPHTPYRPPEPERSRHESRYDGEIAYVDRVVGALLDHWNARRGLEETLVVVTADHGEALGEHGEPTHGVLVHDATLLVPLVIRAPGLTSDQTITEPVSLIDVLPTVLTLLQLPTPDGIQGRNLVPLLRGESLEWSRPSGYAESLYAQLHHGRAPLFTLREDGWKVVHGLDVELYDLAADPAESNDVAGSEPERTAMLGRALEDLIADIKGADAERLVLDEETRRTLESLGYVWSSAPSASPQDAPRDPREALRSMARMADADRRLVAKDVQGAIAGYRAVIDVEPASVDARVRLAQIFISQDDGSQAIRLLAEAVAIAPHEPILHQKLGYTLGRFGRYDEGLTTFEAGLSRFPDERGLRDGRWQCLYQLGRVELLLEEAKRAIASDSTDGMARHIRALACCGEQVDTYVAALEQEVAELPGNPILETALARARAGGN